MQQLPVPVGPIQEMTYSASATRFSVWSPMAQAAKVNLYDSDLAGNKLGEVELHKGTDGNWTATLPGNHHGKYYTFQVQIDGNWQPETPGIFATTVGTNGQRACIMAMNETDPEGWGSDKRPLFNGVQDAVIYEMHHRDFSMDPALGTKHHGKYLALTEAPAIEHLKQLGITHVHLLPSYDFGSIDEQTGYALGGGGRTSGITYNWGYDPVNYNSPEGSYATKTDPLTRCREFKEMVMALHKAGIRVVMDVVYNHVFDLGQSNFQKTCPNYFFRWKDDGKTAANGSGCGNETASEMPMMRKFMVQSVLFWMNEYHIDGFRFDLMGIHDIATMNAIREAAQGVDPNVLIYGEGWAAESPALPQEQLAMKANACQLGGIAAFGDEMRDGLRGGWHDDKVGAFVVAQKTADNGASDAESVKFGIVGAVQHPDIDYNKVNYSKAPWASQPTQMISYVSCHDDMCIADRLKATTASSTKGKGKLASQEHLASLQKLAYTAVLTSQGLPFIWCGDEMMRDRKGVHNCYASPDSINTIPWVNKEKHRDIFDYISGLIALRKAHPAFRMADAETVRQNLRFLPTKNARVIAWQLNGTAVGDEWGTIIVVLNSNDKAVKQSIPQGKWTIVAKDGEILAPAKKVINGKTVTIPAHSALIIRF